MRAKRGVWHAVKVPSTAGMVYDLPITTPISILTLQQNVHFRKSQNPLFLSKNPFRYNHSPISCSGNHWPLHSLSNIENIAVLAALGVHLLPLMIIWKMDIHRFCCSL